MYDDVGSGGEVGSGDWSALAVLNAPYAKGNGAGAETIYCCCCASTGCAVAYASSYASSHLHYVAAPVVSRARLGAPLRRP